MRRKGMEMGVPGKRMRGKPTRRWTHNVRECMREVGLEEEDSGDGKVDAGYPLYRFHM